MKVSTRGRYALRFMLYLTKQQDKVVSLKDVSKEEDISLKYLEQIASTLTKQKMVTSIRGAKGGYCLSNPANTYKVGEILRVVEGSICPVSCVEEGAICPRKDSCPTIVFWQGLDKVISDYLNAYTLTDLVNLDNGDFVI